MLVKIIMADYHNSRHSADIVYLLNAYALDPMGGGQPLTDEVKQTLINRLGQTSGAFSVLAYDNDKAIALANCFIGFSTFKAKPLVNVHDLTVDSAYRGQGISQKILDKVSEIAKDKDACKITLEVLEGNKAAQRAYRKFGFAEYELEASAGKALFWQKEL